MLKKAHDAKIPVIAFDSGVDSDVPLTTCVTDNLVAAGLAADKMTEAIGDSGKVRSRRARPDEPHRHRPARTHEKHCRRLWPLCLSRFCTSFPKGEPYCGFNSDLRQVLRIRMAWPLGGCKQKRPRSRPAGPAATARAGRLAWAT